MTGKAKRPHASQQRAADSIRQEVATYVAAGADESVQRVITSVHGLSRRLNQWYDRQLADLDVSTGEWAVLSKLARDGGERGLTPSVLADAAGVAPSSMTHRLDRMTQRGLVSRLTDPENRVRVLVTLTDEGWALFRSAIQESDMVEADILQPLSEQERVRLAELLDGVIDGLEALEHRGRPVQSQPSGRSSAGHLGLR